MKNRKAEDFRQGLVENDIMESGGWWMKMEEEWTQGEHLKWSYQHCFGTWLWIFLGFFCPQQVYQRWVKWLALLIGRVGGSWGTQTMTTIIYKVVARRTSGVGMVNKQRNPRFLRIVLAQYWAPREPFSGSERFHWWDERFCVCRCQNWREVLPGWVTAAAIKFSLGSFWRFILTTIRWSGFKYKSMLSR